MKAINDQISADEIERRRIDKIIEETAKNSEFYVKEE